MVMNNTRDKEAAELMKDSGAKALESIREGHPLKDIFDQYEQRLLVEWACRTYLGYSK